MPRPLRRAVSIASQATGVRDRAEPRPPAPILIGAARSGTDLLGAMLGAHPDLAMLRETGFVPRLAEMIRSEPMTVERVIKLMAAAGPLEAHGLSEEEMRRRLIELDDLKAAAVLRCFYEAAAANAGKTRWGDETPSYLKRMRRIQRALSEARFIHVVRDGRDTLAARPAEINAGAAIATGQRWHKRVRSVRVQAHLMNHLLEIRYEDLIADPESTLRARLRVHRAAVRRRRWSIRPSAAGSSPSSAPVGCWRERLEPEQLGAFEEVAGEMLDELGYRSDAPSAVR